MRPHRVGVTRRFPRTARVRTRAEYDRIFQHGRRVALPVLALHWRPAMPPSTADGTDAPPVAPPLPDAGARLGLAVSRKVDRRAVVRNRIKRGLRETFRAHRATLAPGEYVVVARPGAAALDAPALQRTLLTLLTRAGALPPVPPAGTMPPAACTDPVQPPSR